MCDEDVGPVAGQRRRSAQSGGSRPATGSRSVHSQVVAEPVAVTPWGTVPAPLPLPSAATITTAAATAAAAAPLSSPVAASFASGALSPRESGSATSTPSNGALSASPAASAHLSASGALPAPVVVATRISSASPANVPGTCDAGIVAALRDLQPFDHSSVHHPMYVQRSTPSASAYGCVSVSGYGQYAGAGNATLGGVVLSGGDRDDSQSLQRRRMSALASHVPALGAREWDGAAALGAALNTLSQSGACGRAFAASTDEHDHVVVTSHPLHRPADTDDRSTFSARGFVSGVLP
jgi:hypothetical protein